MSDAATRRLVRERANHRCEYCRLPQASVPFFTFHIEHIVARQHGGSDAEDNLCLACPDCNRCKGTNLATIDSESGAILRLFNPRIDQWSEHFVMLHAEIVGLTPVGQATIRLLQFNSEERVREREELLQHGELQ